MKRSLLVFSLAFSLLAGAAVPGVQAQSGLNIGVIDMQDCLNKYYRTKEEVAAVNAIAQEKQKEIDAKRSDYETLTAQAATLDEQARDSVLSQEQRQAAFAKLQEVMQERMAKGREIQEAERRAQQEIIDARQKMEATLVASIRELVNARSAEKGLDLVYDKSFLPKANKVILFTSDKVPDLTEEIIAELNKDAPAGATTSATDAATATEATTGN